jgi:protein SCO1/2
MQQSFLYAELGKKLPGAQVITRVTIGAVCCGLLFANATLVRAEEHQHTSEHAEHMHAMSHDMHEHAMDHSQHEQQLAKKGAHKISVISMSIPDVKLTDMHGAQVALNDVLDKDSSIILNFVFTTCTTICPAMSGTFQQVQTKLGKKRREAKLVSISIDPENDTPAKLKEFAANYQAGPQWKLLTGTYENSVLVQKAFEVYAGDKMNHKPVTFLRAKGTANTWVRIDGLVDAAVILKEYDKLNKPKKSKQ